MKTKISADKLRLGIACGQIIDAIGETAREGLTDTPQRFANAWAHWSSGYGVDPADVLKSFNDGAENVNAMVLVTNIRVHSKCEHHLADIFGLAHVAYIPNGKIVGLSKIPRLVDMFARRLQVQERLTTQIANALDNALSPIGVGVVLQCRHMCLESRGIQMNGTITTTSSMLGAFYDEAHTRAELLNLITAARNGVTI